MCVCVCGGGVMRRKCGGCNLWSVNGEGGESKLCGLGEGGNKEKKWFGGVGM